MSPTQLVEDILVGQGVTVSNVQFTGSNNAIGSFEGSNTSVGLDEGIILTTGTINSGSEGPYGPNDKPNAGIDNGAGGYAPLSNLVGANTFNAAVLTFNFVPQADSVKFRYVFGSEEYPEWVGDQFNDVFAFFISGPGIQGQKNMALIPGTTQPVAINNVNNGTANNGPCQNCQYYVNNGTGGNAPYNQDPFYIQYDGLTTPLEAVSEVQCGETYQLVIAISDVGDAIYDSGIFLEASSLSSEQPVMVNYELSDYPFGNQQTMAQGCTSATFTITRSGDGLDQPLTVPINVLGSAVEGLDFTNIPEEITFPANETEVSFSFDALNNPNLTNPVSITLQFEITDPCGQSNFQTVELFINPVEDVDVEITSNEIVCPGDLVNLTAEASGGGGGYEYQWSTGEDTQSITVNPESTETFSVSVTDECLNQTAIDEVEVDVPDFDELTLSTTDDIEDDCPYIPFDLSVTPQGGAGGFNYTWTNENGGVISNSPTVTVVPPTSSIYYIEVFDQCGESTKDSVQITILSPPLEIDVSPAIEICPGDTAELSVEATGGFGDYYYFWVETEDTTPSINVSPDFSTNYTIEVMDDCRSFKVSDETSVTVVQPDAKFRVITDPLFNGLPITFQNLTNNGNFYDWDFGDGNISNEIHPNNIYDEPGTYEVTLVAEDLKGCIDSTFLVIDIREEYYVYVPNTFTPDGDRYNNTFKISTVNIDELYFIIFNRWGEVMFESFNPVFEWDGTYGGRPVKDGTYIWKMEYTTSEGEKFERNGHLNVIR